MSEILHFLWSFLVSKFIALLAIFWLRMFFLFFQILPQFHGLKSKLNKIWYANFMEFKYDRSNRLNEWAFGKQTLSVFIFILLTPTLKSFFHTLSWTSKRNYFISAIHTKFIFWITFFYIFDTVINVAKNWFSKKLNFLGNQLDAIVFCFFQSHNPKQKNLPPNGQ